MKQKTKLTFCKYCKKKTKSTESYEEHLHPYKMIRFFVCEKCKLPKDNTHANEQEVKQDDSTKTLSASSSCNNQHTKSSILNKGAQDPLDGVANRSSVEQNADFDLSNKIRDVSYFSERTPLIYSEDVKEAVRILKELFEKAKTKDPWDYHIIVMDYDGFIEKVNSIFGD